MQPSDPPPQKVYPTQPFGWRDALPGLLFALPAAILPITLGIARLYDTYPRYGPVPAFARSSPWLGAGLIGLLLTILILFYRWQLTRRTIQLTKEGLLLSGFRQRSLTWIDLSGIAFQVSQQAGRAEGRRLNYYLCLFTKSGKSFKLSGSSLDPHGSGGLPELASQIKAHVYPTLTQRLTGELLTGRWIAFGPLKIHKNGLQLNGWRRSFFPWESVRRIGVESGYIVVELARPHASPLVKRYPTYRVPNLEILINLIENAVPL